MTSSKVEGIFVPLAVIALVGCVATSILAGEDNPALRFAAMALGTVFATGLLIYRIATLRRR